MAVQQDALAVVIDPGVAAGALGDGLGLDGEDAAGADQGVIDVESLAGDVVEDVVAQGPRLLQHPPDLPLAADTELQVAQLGPHAPEVPKAQQHQKAAKNHPMPGAGLAACPTNDQFGQADGYRRDPCDPYGKCAAKEKVDRCIP